MLSEDVKKRASKYIVLTGIEEIDKCSIIALENVRRLVKIGLPMDSVKYCIPESMRTSFSWTINLRSFINFLELRTDKHAHFEIRHIANEMRRMISESSAAKYVDEILNQMEL